MSKIYRQPYVLREDFPNLGEIDIDIFPLFDVLSGIAVHNAETFGQIKYYNYLSRPCLLEYTPTSSYLNEPTLRCLLLEHIYNSYDDSFIGNDEFSKNKNLRSEIRDLINLNRYEFYSVAEELKVFYDNEIEFATMLNADSEKKVSIIIDARNVIYPFANTFQEINDFNNIEIYNLTSRIHFLNALGILDFLENNWRFDNYNLSSNKSKFAELLSYFLIDGKEQIRNVIKDERYTESNKAKKEFQRIINNLQLKKNN
jgi:hypothetical protein